MKAGWGIKPLGELCDILDNRRKPVTKSDRIAGPYPYYGATGIQDFVNDFLFDEPLVLVGEDGAKWESGENTAFPIEGKCWVNNHAHVLRPIRERLLDNWLIHFLNHSDLTEYVSGLTVPKLNQGSLREIRIPLAPIEEQRRIVTLLDEAFADIVTAKANAEKNLQNARELFESQRQFLLQPKEGWHVATLTDLCNIKHGYAFEGEYFSDSGDHVLLTPGSFFETGGFRDRGDKTKYFTGPIPTDYVLSQGDLLVAMTEQAAGLLGSPLLVPESNRFLHNQRLGLVTGKPAVHWTNEFFFHVFNLEAVRKAIHASASGAKVRHTSPGKIGAVQVAFPDNQAEQLRIAAQVEEIEQASIALQSIYRQKLTALDNLKKSLLHQAFSGQL